jgi:DNA-binding NtrC family response regulator
LAVIMEKRALTHPVESLQERPALVLSDLQMPDMGGLNVLAAMAAEFEETPIIIVSGQGELDDAIQALKLGAWDYTLSR